ncbi:hypothetical protein [Aestuariibaculum suncheonense]|uniref:Uncharacterized protein n=1 Tax=Aestuariibaculum suncheonense TaxID=1028745 RepID=A0A8J6QQW4_9FLAO|nr:hypothetical protein [Aestuariibaculum suncheonense]MBD0834699.1 hypothetical protein [Aestuariibaculum suncheonense]
MIKKIPYFLLVALILNCTNEVDNNSNAKPLATFKMSLDYWSNLKQLHNASYNYTVSSKTELGYNCNTSITVENGIIMSRAFEVYTQYDDEANYLDFENRIILKSFFEDKTALGTHNCKSNDDDYNSISFCNAAPALTIDELYNTCLKKYLSVNPTSNEINFNVDDENLLKECYYTSNTCDDDCSFGIKLTHFEWLQSDS